MPVGPKSGSRTMTAGGPTAKGGMMNAKNGMNNNQMKKPGHGSMPMARKTNGSVGGIGGKMNGSAGFGGNQHQHGKKYDTIREKANDSNDRDKDLRIRKDLLTIGFACSMMTSPKLGRKFASSPHVDSNFG